MIFSRPGFTFRFYSDGDRAWPGSEMEAFSIIEVGYRYTSLEASLKGFTDKDLPKKLIKNTKGWTFDEVICSALAHRYVNRYDENSPQPKRLVVRSSAWYPITRLLMNSHISDSLSFFLEGFSDFRFCYSHFIFFEIENGYQKTVYEEMVKTMILSLNNHKFPFADEKCVKSLLNLTNTEYFGIDDFETVIKKFSVEKDLKKVSTSLSLLLNKVNKIDLVNLNEEERRKIKRPPPEDPEESIKRKLMGPPPPEKIIKRKRLPPLAPL